LDRLRPGQRELVAEAVTTYKAIRTTIPQRFPIWPCGLPGWDDRWLALGLVGDADTLVTLFRRPGASPQVSLSLPRYVGRQLGVEALFPTGLAVWETAWDAESGTLWVVGGGDGLATRTFRVTPS
jgi:alpha-galactosidase